MYQIGQFAQQYNVSVSALRYYAEIGLLKPNYVDRFTGYRYYMREQIQSLNRILDLKELGLSLEEIKQMLNEKLSLDEAEALLQRKSLELDEEILRLQAQLGRVGARLQQITFERNDTAEGWQEFMSLLEKWCVVFG